MGGVIQQKKNKDIMGGVNMWFCATVIGFCKDINCSSVSVSAGTIHTINLAWVISPLYYKPLRWSAAFLVLSSLILILLSH